MAEAAKDHLNKRKYAKTRNSQATRQKDCAGSPSWANMVSCMSLVQGQPQQIRGPLWFSLVRMKALLCEASHWPCSKGW